MSHERILLDANVLYPAPIRDILLQVAVDDFFQAKWTTTIHEEWITALLENAPQRQRAVLERTRSLMDKAVPDSLISGYESLIDCLELPDPDDRHVLAAAIVGRCDFILTQNLKDFPSSILSSYQIEAQHPDDFLVNLLRLSSGKFCASVRKVRARLKNPPYSVQDYLTTLTRQGLVATVSELEQFAALL